MGIIRLIQSMTLVFGNSVEPPISGYIIIYKPNVTRSCFISRSRTNHGPLAVTINKPNNSAWSGNRHAFQVTRVSLTRRATLIVNLSEQFVEYSANLIVK